MFADEDEKQAGEILKHLQLLERVEFDIVSQNDILASDETSIFFAQHISDAKAILILVSIDFDIDFWLAKIPIQRRIIAIYLRHLDKSLYFRNVKHLNFTLLNKKPLHSTDDYYSKIIKKLKQKLIPTIKKLDKTEYIAIWFF